MAKSCLEYILINSTEGHLTFPDDWTSFPCGKLNVNYYQIPAFSIHWHYDRLVDMNEKTFFFSYVYEKKETEKALFRHFWGDIEYRE